ncbi:MAG: FAD-linked oxidase C-terminal domain-containing protein [Myxococcales bacterium]
MTSKAEAGSAKTQSPIHLPVHPVHYRGRVTVSADAPVAPGDQRLASELRGVVSGEVRFDQGSRAAYSTDASNYRQVPLGLVLPRTVEDVVNVVNICRKHGAPITSRGGGTSLAGQTCNVAVVIDFSKYMNAVLEIDPVARTARVQPGCNLDELRRKAAVHGLTFGPDPATHNRNTLGGMIGNNSCGVHSVMAQLYGPGPLTRHQIRALDILTYEGERFTVGKTSPEEMAAIIAAGGRRAEIYRGLRDLRDRHRDQIRARFPNIPRRVSGYNLDALLEENGFDVAQALVGTEGTCVVLLEATVTLIDARPARSLVVLGYPDVYTAADAVPEIIKHKPVGLEGLDDELIGYMKKKGMHPDDVKMLPEGKGWLLVEFGADTEDNSREQARRFMAALDGGSKPRPSMKLLDDKQQEQKLWEVRESGLGATAHVPGLGETHPGWEDAAVPPAAVGAYLREFRRLLDEFGYHAALYGHFGQGCVHCRIDFDLATPAGVKKWLAFLVRAADLVVGHGGSLSGEHGDGQARAWLLPKMFGAEIVQAFGTFKRLWDPAGKMNPGKVVDPAPPDQDLRKGPSYEPKQLQTHFAFAADGGSFAKATGRCVGVGACRRVEGGVMCPSYMVTREEEDSTRGRARLLFEMARGDVLTDGWRNESVKNALDLCLACKGCRSDCPVNVDMATYKAEFLSHYYAGRLRPRAAYAMGLVFWWARLAAPFAPVINFLARLPVLASFIKWVAGLAQQRDIPPLASPTFRHWFEHRERRQSTGAGQRKRVLLWPDTFNNFLMTGAARAAVAVLESAGYVVEIPSTPLCCGRPLYDSGMLTTAKKVWNRTLEGLRPYIRDGIPVVGLEPSCVAAFRDELLGLFPTNEDAQRLAKQTFLLSEFLDREGYQPPPLPRRALVQGHCHHKSVLGMQSETSLLDKLGLDYQVLDSGCCGMAGSFGFEAEHYEVSIAAGERVLLPAVRAAAADTLIVANGFSCRQQILQTTGRTPLHLAEVLQMAIKGTEPPRHSQSTPAREG